MTWRSTVTFVLELKMTDDGGTPMPFSVRSESASLAIGSPDLMP
jgi:hypothetical protein